MNDEKMSDSINLFDLIKYALKYRRIILLAALAGLAIGVVLSVFSFMRGEMTKQYTVKTSIAVTSQTEDGLFTSNSLSPNSTDIHLAEDMVDSVIFVIRSDRTLEEAVEKLGLIGISAKDICDNLSFEQYKSTQIIEISLKWRNAEEGKKILDAINDVSPAILVDILKIGDVRVVNDPKAKYILGGSINASMWLLATAVGAFLGLGFAFLMMLLSPTLVSRDNVKDRLGLRIIGEIPKDKHYLPAGAFITDAGAMSAAVRDSYTAAAHILRRNIGGPGVFYVTSAESAEGKTSVAANLALALSSLEKKVLLADMNFDSPNLAKRFAAEVDYEHSLNAVYQGEVAIDDAVLPVNGFLHLLPFIQDDRRCIINEAILDMIAEKAKAYDYTIIDTSSVGRSAEVLNLNRIADAALLTVQYDRVKLKTVENAETRLKDSGIPIIGCVVNRVGKLW